MGSYSEKRYIWQICEVQGEMGLKMFQDKQKLDQQTDSPTSTRPGLRTICQLAANKGWDLFFHTDLMFAV